MALAAFEAIRSTVGYLRDPLRYLELAGLRGDVVPFNLFGIPIYLLTHPDDIARVVVTEHKTFPKRHRFLQELRRFAGDGLALSDGELWRRQRTLMQPLFFRERIHGYAEDLAAAAARTLAGWRPGETRDLYAEMMRILLDSVARSLFSAEAPTGARQVAADVTAIMEWFAHPAFMMGRMLERLPLASMRRVREALAGLDETIAGLIAARRGGASRDDLLGALLGARDEAGAPMADRQVRDEVFTLFIGGYEPSAVALGWLFYLLGRHPKVMARAVEEARAVVGDRVPTRDDLPKLTYLGQVVNESLRLYPPAWVIAREADTATEIRGHAIPRGGMVWCSQWVTHRDARWFDAPTEFRPQRWEGDLAKRLPKSAYFPYGGGPRVCIGGVLAQAQVTSLAALLLSRFRLELVPERSPRPLPSVNLRPHGGVWARLS